MKKYKNSLVLGKFYPVTNGHLYLIDTAIENSECVNVMVCYNSGQNISGNIRYDVLKDIYKENKNVNILLVDDTGLPQHDYECNTLDEFYNYWIPFVYKSVQNLDAVFTSENYGDDFANYLGIKHHLVDIERKKVPISGTKIRNNPFKYWEFIPKQMKSYFIKRIAIMGPESVGKSTLSINLSKYFKTEFVEEYGRTIFEKNGNKIDIDDFIPISIGRQNLENDKIRNCNKLIFCDTEDITTYLFYKMYFPNDFKSIENWFKNSFKNKKKYDLYILLKPDCDAIQDGTRQFLTERNEHYEEIKKYLIKQNCEFIEVGGNWGNRLKKSIDFIKNNFNI